jgi:hypothetical protein
MNIIYEYNRKKDQKKKNTKDHLRGKEKSSRREMLTGYIPLYFMILNWVILFPFCVFIWGI